jgi:hypothetical protein
LLLLSSSTSALSVTASFSSAAGLKDVTPAAIWDHLATLYDLSAADDVEASAAQLAKAGRSPPDSGAEFALPRRDFQSVIREMRKDGENQNEDVRRGNSNSVSTGKISAENPAAAAAAAATPKDPAAKKSSAATATPKESAAASSTPSTVEETPKSTPGLGGGGGSSSSKKRPTRSTPGTTPAKRRK